MTTTKKRDDEDDEELAENYQWLLENWGKPKAGWLWLLRQDRILRRKNRQSSKTATNV